MDNFFTQLLEFFYILIGLQLFFTAFKAFKDNTNPKRIGTTLFWAILGVLFSLGNLLPDMVNGILVVSLGVITLFKQLAIGKFPAPDSAFADKEAKRLGSQIFIPVVLLALIALVIAFFIPASSRAVIGIAAVLATISALIIFKTGPKEMLNESNRMVQQVGGVGILPQLLAALGVIFTMAGVGDVIANLIGGVVPVDNRFLGVTAYVLGMVIFTMIMGNAFAAFTVITAGIGIPFVIAQGADPAIAGALAMTAGFCGTLLTPMAGNFNVLPVALLEIKNPYGVIKSQAPTALILIVVHIALMYFWAF